VRAVDRARGRQRALASAGGAHAPGRHLVGNHTYEHRFPIEARELVLEIAAADALIRELRSEAGVPVATPIPFRLPYGIRLEGGQLDPRVAAAAGQGRTHTHWSSDFEDWTMKAGDDARLADAMIAHVAALAAEGRDAVLDLHDSAPVARGATRGPRPCWRPSALSTRRGGARGFLPRAQELRR